jgi:hypothetical protein
MNVLSQLYNRLSDQISVCQTNLNSLCRRLEIIEQLIIENVTSIEESTHGVRIHPRSSTSQPPDEIDPYVLERVLITLLGGAAAPPDVNVISAQDRGTYINDMYFRDLTNPPTQTCPITMERFEPSSKILQLKSCGHYFAECGLLPWLSMSAHCPICRKSMRSIDSGL